MWTLEFLPRFTRAFLVRDPARTISSMHSKWPDYDELEVGFPEQTALFDLLTASHGKLSPVTDCDDLLENPEGMVAAFCESVGIPFMAEAMNRGPDGDPSAHGWRPAENLPLF